MINLTVGVLGGMGPAATVDFLDRLVQVTPAERDQEHVPVLVYGDPRVPDRTLAIQRKGASPLPQLIQGATFLERAGVGCIAMPCNTAHAWYDDLQASVAIPILHIVDAAAARLVRHVAEGAKVGVLSTAGTQEAELYPPRLQQRNLLGFGLDAGDVHEFVTPGIAAVKAGRLGEGRQLLRAAAERLVSGGAEAIVVACTDISVVLREPGQVQGRPLIDANLSLAHATLEAVSKDGFVPALTADGSADR